MLALFHRQAREPEQHSKPANLNNLPTEVIDIIAGFLADEPSAVVPAPAGFVSWFRTGRRAPTGCRCWDERNLERIDEGALEVELRKNPRLALSCVSRRMKMIFVGRLWEEVSTQWCEVRIRVYGGALPESRAHVRNLSVHIDRDHFVGQDSNLQQFLRLFPNLQKVHLHWFKEEWFGALLTSPNNTRSEWSALELTVDAHRRGFGLPGAVEPLRQLLPMEHVETLTVRFRPPDRMLQQVEEWSLMTSTMAGLRDLGVTTLQLVFKINSTMFHWPALWNLLLACLAGASRDSKIRHLRLEVDFVFLFESTPGHRDEGNQIPASLLPTRSVFEEHAREIKRSCAELQSVECRVGGFIENSRTDARCEIMDFSWQQLPATHMETMVAEDPSAEDISITDQSEYDFHPTSVMEMYASERAARGATRNGHGFGFGVGL